MAKTRVLDVPIFSARIVLLTTREAFLRRRARLTDDPLDLDDANGCSSDHGMCYLVGVFDGRLATLVHELGHTAFKILHDCNVPVRRDGQMEAFCYLQEYLFEQLRSSVGG